MNAGKTEEKKAGDRRQETEEKTALFEETLNSCKTQNYVLRLYVADKLASSVSAICNLA
jgi:hypothetical protein